MINDPLPELVELGLESSEPFDALDVEEFRTFMASPSLAAVDADDGVEVEDLLLGTSAQPIHTRRYLSRSASSDCARLIWVHGGGFVAGGIDSHEQAVRKVVRATECEALLFEYRLAPEDPFPAAFDDVCIVISQAAGRRDGPVVVIGDSAGGALATSALANTAGDVDGLVLLYPMLDDRPAAEVEGQVGGSYGELDGRVLLSVNAVHQFWAAYRGPVPVDDGRVVPARLESVSRLPPTLVVIANLDVLRDEAWRFVKRLEHEGVPVSTWSEPKGIHGFLGIPAVTAEAERTIAAIDRFVSGLAARRPRRD